MDIDTLNRRRGQNTPTTKPVPATPLRAVDTQPIEAETLNTGLLRDAVREAGLFQRSVLGHLDHKEWRDRVFMDGQRLVDLLAEIGFRPTERVARKSA